MGSRFSKAVRPHKAAAARQQSDNSTRAPAGPRQDIAPREGGLKAACVVVRAVVSSDDFDLPTTTTTTLPLRRNSEPVIAMSGASTNSEHTAQIASFEEWFSLQRLVGIVDAVSHGGDTTAFPPPLPNVPSEPQAPTEHQPQCLVCCTQLPKEKDPDYNTKVVKPCRECDNEYCVNCVRKLFIDACKDMSRMPPRCCVRVNLHHARPFLSDEEATLFRAKYEEWSTPKPFYCPVPVCSAFIPTRLLPQQNTEKNKGRVDSGVGTPTANTFACPTCVVDICTICRQVAHPGTNCEINEFGLDADTAALLISWGYKKCPKCGHGVKRMYGCNHMECRCGAHFCWTCMEENGQCRGECYESEEDNGDDQSEPDVDEDEEVAEASQEAKVEGATTSDEAAGKSPEPELTARVKNLDGGRATYWEESGLDFGEEPNDIQDKSWDCEHSFYEYEVSLAEALNRPHAHDMECIKCWSTVHPSITTPCTSQKSRPKMVPATATRHLRGGIRRARGRYTPPRGLVRHDATIGTAPHLTTELSQSVPTRTTIPMEDVQFTHRVQDTYGNGIITTKPKSPPTRRASTTAHPPEPHPSVLNTPKSTFSLAYECISCQMLVCKSCRDIAMGIHNTPTSPLLSQEPSEHTDYATSNEVLLADKFPEWSPSAPGTITLTAEEEYENEWLEYQRRLGL